MLVKVEYMRSWCDSSVVSSQELHTAFLNAHGEEGWELTGPLMQDIQQNPLALSNAPPRVRFMHIFMRKHFELEELEEELDVIEDAEVVSP